MAPTCFNNAKWIWSCGVNLRSKLRMGGVPVWESVAPTAPVAPRLRCRGIASISLTDLWPSLALQLSTRDISTRGFERARLPEDHPSLMKTHGLSKQLRWRQQERSRRLTVVNSNLCSSLIHDNADISSFSWMRNTRTCTSSVHGRSEISTKILEVQAFNAPDRVRILHDTPWKVGIITPSYQKLVASQSSCEDLSGWLRIINCA